MVSLARLPVLLVDRGLGAVQFVESALRESGHDVHKATDELQAAELFAEHRPRVTFIDFVDGVKNRQGLIRQLRKLDARAGIIAIVSRTDMSGLGLLRDCGVTEVITSAARPATPPRKSIEPTTGASRVFVVDDEPTIVALLSRFLVMRGYEVHGACSGQDALKQFSEHHPDVILFDLLMPGMTGLEVLRALRETGFGGTGIALSASQDDVLVRKLMHVGPVHLVGKPVDLERLALLLQAVLILQSAEVS